MLKRISQILMIIIPLLVICCDNESYLAYDNIEMLSSKGGHYGKSRPYKMKSANDSFLLESIPYEHVNVIPGDLCGGITNVYDIINDSIVYTIHRYFGVDNTFFSENGKTLVYVNDFWRGTSYDSCSTNILEFYTNGILEKTYSFEELLRQEASDDTYSWLYKNPKSNDWLSENNRYLIANKLYLISEVTGTVFIFDVNEAELIKEVDTTTFQKNLIYIEQKKSDIEFISIEEFELLPNLRNGKSFRNELSQNLNLELIPIDGQRKIDRYYFYIGIEAEIDTTGKCKELNVFLNENVLLKTAGQIKTNIRTFVKNSYFINDSIPYGLNKWLFEDRFYVSRNPASLSLEDLKNYENQVCRLDTIANIYIPKDLTDAHFQLDLILDDNAKKQIMDGESTHFGLGRWMRNNWGLWQGGRLKCYFDDRELYHPDHISSLIIEAYKLKLLNEPFNQDSLILEASNAEKEWIKD